MSSSSRSRSFLLTLAVALLALVGTGAATGCAHGGRGRAIGTPVPGDSTVTLAVQNDNYADMNVWVVSYGLPTLLGVVPGNGRQSFTLAESVTRGPDLRIVAAPIGGNGRAGSGQLLVQPGQTIDFHIAPRLRMSTATVR